MAEPHPPGRRSPGSTATLHGLPSIPSPRPAEGPVAGDALLRKAMRAAERLCARATTGGVLPSAAHGDVALELRALLPLVDDALFDQHLARIDRIAHHISAAEAADADNTAAYADAAWEAVLDLADFITTADADADADRGLAEGTSGHAVYDVAAFRFAVIEHWDLALHRQVAELVAADRASASPPRPGHIRTPHAG